VEWDSWRRQDGSWTVAARFEPKREGPAGIGEEPPALWTFSPARKSLQNANRWAQQLSELEPLDGPVPARRLTAVSDRPFDFETDAEAAARNATGPQPILQAKESDGLLDMLRSRRGQRLGVDEDADDALALLLSLGVPAAHPRPSEVTAEQGTGEDTEQDSQEDPPPETTGPDSTAAAAHPDPVARKRDGRPSMLSRLSLIPPHRSADEDDNLKLHDGVSTETREITIVASPPRPAHPVAPAEGPGEAGPPATSVGLDELLGGSPRRAAYAAGSDDPAPGRHQDADLPERQPAKPKRSTVPSWDEIVFGTKRD
jgi:hypothetical protein